ASKSAAFAVFARVFYTALHDFQVDWSNVLAVVAALSMIIGNFAAITQTSVKRMLAYSSIGHAGYVLLGVIALSPMGIQGILVYSIVYVFANLGIWATVLMLRRHGYATEEVDDFNGLAKRSPFWAFAMIVFLLSLGGIPPTAGFIGKYYLFYAAMQAGFGKLAVIAVLMSAVSMFYYLRLVMAMYLKEGTEADVVITRPLQFVAAVCLIVTFFYGVYPSPLAKVTADSSAWISSHSTPGANGGR
ncbi:MAG: dehydrogenase subunit, partial [Acidobacteria bacterium]|nr:dehydrogenase subunit [Acidobacteriota bacterium]